MPDAGALGGGNKAPELSQLLQDWGGVQDGAPRSWCAKHMLHHLLDPRQLVQNKRSAAL